MAIPGYAPLTTPVEIQLSWTAITTATPASGSTTLVTDWAELVSKAITHGKHHKDLFKHGHYSTFEAISRAYSLWSYLTSSTASPRVERTPAFLDLDATEKGAASYLIGMTAAAVAADALLGAPELLHVSTYGQAYGVAFSGNQRPDLFGPLDAGGWVVVEAKGRSNGISANELTKALNQKAAIATINNSPPALSVVSVSHFPQGELAIALHDPPPGGGDIVIDEESFYRLYYQPIADIIDQLDPIEIDPNTFVDDSLERPRLHAAFIPEIDVTVGLDVEIYRRLRANLELTPVVAPRRRGQEAERLRRASRSRSPDRSNSVSVTDDGVGVVLGGSWSPETTRGRRGQTG